MADFRDWPTNPGDSRDKPGDSRDIDFRHGLLMREVEELKDRIEFLERVNRKSMRPQVVTGITVSVVVSGIVTGIIQGLGQAFR